MPVPLDKWASQKRQELQRNSEVWERDLAANTQRLETEREKLQKVEDLVAEYEEVNCELLELEVCWSVDIASIRSLLFRVF